MGSLISPSNYLLIFTKSVLRMNSFTFSTRTSALVGKVLAVAAFVLFGLTAFAQVTTSTIAGSVTDAKGDALVGATVVATHVPSGTRYGTATNAAGRFNLPAVRVGGPFTVVVTYTGFEPQTRDNVYTSLGTATNLKFDLQESATLVNEVAIVARRNDIFSSERTGAAVTFDNTAIAQVPVIGSRSISEVTKYSPFGNGRSFGGQDTRMNNFTIDGSVFNNGFGLGSETPAGGRTNSTAISLDAIQELQVNIAPFDVRQSGFVGSGMNAVTRSGTNEYSGSVYTFFRNNSSTFNGSKVNGQDITLGKFNENVYGARIGGPLIKDKLFFFANYEMVKRTEPAQTWYAQGSPNAAPGDQVTRVQYQDMVDISKFMQDKFGYETGPFENYDDQTDSKKFLVRLDYNLSDKHKLTLRYTHHDSEDYVLISNSSSLGFGNRRTNSDAMSFKNSGYLIQDNTRSIVGEWNWTINNNLHNTFLIGYDKQIENRGYAGAFFPTIDILDNNRTYISLGMDPFTPDNSLDYGTFHVTNNLSYYTGRHTITGGVNYEYYKSNNLFFPGSNGVYVFNSLADFYAAANDAIDNPNATSSPVKLNRFQFRYSALEGAAKPWQVLEVNRFDLYGQDNYQVSDNFSLLYGLRVGTILFGNTALENPAITSQTYIDLDGNRNYKINTGKMPNTQILWEPRLGFNWDASGNKTTQVRGGTGIFTGRPPYVWVSNQVGNNGILTGFIDDRNSATYPFRADASGFIPATPTLPSTFDIAVSDPDYKFPQVWKSNFAVDQKLPLGLIATAELLYNKNINSVLYFDANLEPANGTFSGPDTRPRFPGSGSSNVANDTRINDNVARAAVMSTTNEGSYFGATFKLEYPASHGFYAMASYTYSQAKDLMSAGSIASGSWQSARSYRGNNDLDLAYADNDIPHRISGILGYRLEYGGNFGGATGISLGYVGDQSGRVSYVAAGDMNGDNVFNNDLIWVPNNASELTFQEFTSGGKTFTVADQVAAFNAFIDQDDYLSTRRGMYAERNGRVFPWLHRFDLSVTQDFYIKIGGKRNAIQFRADILNVGNLLNDSWGVGNTLVTDRPLTYRTVNANGVPEYRFATQTINGETQMLKNTFIPSTSPSNVWTAQFGLRYTFN